MLSSPSLHRSMAHAAAAASEILRVTESLDVTKLHCHLAPDALRLGTRSHKRCERRLLPKFSLHNSVYAAAPRSCCSRLTNSPAPSQSNFTAFPCFLSRNKLADFVHCFNFCIILSSIYFTSCKWCRESISCWSP